ncbi:hypothetical protein FD598_09215 [Staphylococcus pseudintermedius]|uniref:hypothetical protein n=1 Tax=Staphylococcus pseudintermedius TaxID=283734 RepID=UPI0007AED4B3|nr:hypothetical protein [Staphylococcus pseudintermedius]EGQ1603775.1 hypothetical protein [Staphylococcus pseudintermedius]EGQ1615965.1 hypothetical protein [Staphylococcus pseudintermedius]EGQ1724429.1 hypothetical protein [Staphylococcus pseudintermedius]EGQ2881635.1 hypothetical protein [Staphylococcus pseudintermedius]EGQ2944617.1 hypothetical protein [Staphylococcus pseudintermedius]
MEHGSKEYYKEQSKYWHNELIKCSKQRDELKRKLDDVVDLFNAHLHHKKAWSDNPYYDKLQNELKRILEEV